MLLTRDMLGMKSYSEQPTTAKNDMKLSTVRNCTIGRRPMNKCQVIIFLVMIMLVAWVVQRDRGRMIDYTDVDYPIVVYTSPVGHNTTSRDVTERLQPIRICTQQERISHMKSVCQRKFEVNRETLMKPAGRSLVDHKHKISFCWISKCANTALKAMMYEANGMDMARYNNSLDDALKGIHKNETNEAYGLEHMDQMNETEQNVVVSSYFKVMSIRHPFERLLSYHLDKLVKSDRPSALPRKAARILRESRPELFANDKTLDRKKLPQKLIGPPTFREFITWIVHNKEYDEHWTFIYDTCHVCAHDWDAILRVETMNTDGRIFAHRLNSTRDGVPVRHSHRNETGRTQFASVLKEFSVLPDDILDYLLDMYRTDMNMFGYKWDRQTNTAYCSIDTPNGPCC